MIISAMNVTKRAKNASKKPKMIAYSVLVDLVLINWIIMCAFCVKSIKDFMLILLISAFSVILLAKRAKEHSKQTAMSAQVLIFSFMLIINVKYVILKMDILFILAIIVVNAILLVKNVQEI